MVWREVDPIQQVTVFETQWTDIPEDVYEEVQQLWRNAGYHNDIAYYAWDTEEDAEYYPKIAAFLESRGVKDCLIHYWWRVDGPHGGVLQ